MSRPPARGAPSRSPAEGSFPARGAPSRSPAEGSFPARGPARGAPSRSPAEGSHRAPSAFLLPLFGSCLTLSSCLSGPVLAASDDAAAWEKGLEIAREARARKIGFHNFTASQSMVLRNKKGQQSRRRLRVKVLEVEGDGDKSMFVFDQPRDVQGTAFLIYAHQVDPDEQWLYLPALKRVKRISSSNRSGSFMGSEFAYEDMSAPEVEKFTYRYLRDESCGEGEGSPRPATLTCTVSERSPTDSKSGYSRQVVWQDKDEFRLWKVEYYDRKETHLKTLTLSNYEHYVDKYWQAGEMTMVNHVTGKSTVLTWSDYQFGTDLDAGDFTQTGLRRVR